jgi:ankyrin repeat protein
MGTTMNGSFPFPVAQPQNQSAFFYVHRTMGNTQPSRKSPWFRTLRAVLIMICGISSVGLYSLLHTVRQQVVDRDLVAAVEKPDYRQIHLLLAQGANADQIIYSDPFDHLNEPPAPTGLAAELKLLWQRMVHGTAKPRQDAYAYTPIVKLYESAEIAELGDHVPGSSAALEDAALDIIHHSTPRGIPTANTFTDYAEQQVEFPLRSGHHRAARELMHRYPHTIMSRNLLEFADEQDTEWMLQHGASPQNVVALANANIAKTALMLRYGASPNLSNGEDQSVLISQCQNGAADVVSLLIRHGANVNAKDASGLTPLHWASAFCKLPTLRELVRAGADVHARAKNGDTCLMFAVSSGRPDSFEYILSLSNRKDICAIGDSNNTALTIALQCPSSPVIKAQADVDNRVFERFAARLKAAGAQQIEPQQSWYSSALEGD